MLKAGRPVCTQGGLVLVITLIILVLVSLAGISLMRSVDATNLLAGNIAFQQAATRAADLGVERAIETLQQLAAAGQLDANDPTNSYFATLHAADSPDRNVAARKDWPTLWSSAIDRNVAAPVTDNFGNAVQFAIHRLCARAAPPNAGGDCVLPPGRTGTEGSSEEAGGIQIHSGAGRVYYRITVRVAGPRQTESYVQVHVTL